MDDFGESLGCIAHVIILVIASAVIVVGFSWFFCWLFYLLAPLFPPF